MADQRLDSSAMRMTTLAEVISSPTSRKNGIAISASESTPLNSCATSTAA